MLMRNFTKKQFAINLPAILPLLFFTFIAAVSENAMARNRFDFSIDDSPLPVHVTSTSGTTSADYSTLADAFAGVNNGIHTGQISIIISSGTTETITAVLNASGTGAALYSSVTINPSGNAVISGNLSAELILFNGADNVTVDGLNSGGNSLTIQNTNTGSANGTSTVKFLADATGNVITNCTILGSATVNIAAGDDGGNIWFSTGTASGNDNNIISNCSISAANGGLPVRLIESRGSTSSAAANNSGITISNCSLFDCFSATSVARMIDINNGSTDFIVSGNKFFQTDVRTQTTGTEFRVISISNPATGNNFQVAGNTIGYSAAFSTGTSIFSGSAGTRLAAVYINAAGSVASVVSDNSITSISLSGNLNGTLASSIFSGIQVAAGLVNITGNTIGAATGNNAINISSSGVGSTDVYGIYNASVSASVISSNIIGSISAGTSANAPFVLYGIRANMNVNAAVTMNNNIIGSKTTALSLNNTSSSSTAARVIGIQNDASAVFSISGNTIANISTDAQNSSGSLPAVVGIRQAASSSVTAFTGSINSDTIYALGSTDPLAGVVVAAMHVTGSTASATTVTIGNNIIHTLTNPSTNSFAELRGIYITGGKATCQNNMIGLGYDASATSLSNNLTINGIYETGGVNNFYFNTVYVGGTGVGGSNKCYALRSLTTGVTRVYKNNIFQNSRSGSGKYYAIQLSGTGTNPTGLTSNSNKFYADGTGGVAGLYGGADRTTLASWQAATGQDAASVYGNPALKTPAGTVASTDLHTDIYGAASENEGISISGINTDIDGESRSATAPDIGADEYSLSPCSIANAGNATVSTGNLCNSGTATLSASGFSNGTTSGYAWEYSNDNFTSDVHSLTSSSLYYATASTGSINSTTYYRHKVTCGATAATAYSNIVAVTVNPSSASINASATNVCAGTSVTLTENSGTANTWSWSTAETTQSILVTPSVSTVYSVGTTGAGGCNANASVTIIVNPLPASVSATASSSTVCAGNSVNLFSTANSVSSTILSEDFNGSFNSWIKINNSTGGDFANAAWTLRPDGYVYSGTNATFHSNDNSQFYLSNSDDQGSGVLTETILQSPAFSLTGYTDVNLGYFHHFSWFSSADFARVEISTDNGANWAVLRTWTSDEGTESSFVNDIINLNAYLNKLVMIRFRYNADFGNYWAIDNVSVTGTPAANSFAWSSNPVGFTSSLQNPTSITPAASTVYTVSVSSASGCVVTASASVTVNENVTYYQDSDGDGYGNPAVSQVSCTGAPAGYAANNTDCSDNNANVHPGAVEICGNGIDDNCDGQIDEGCTLFTFYRDQDGDTYGDAANIITNFTGIPPSGYVSNNTDCNDDNVNVNPGAVEICGNGIDDNCNGQIDETTLQASSAAGVISCAGGTTTVTVSATGGSGIYTGTGNFTRSAGAYSFTVSDTRGCSSITTGNIAAGTGTAPARPGTISGTTFNLCGGGNFTYSVASVSGATSYTWTVPAGFNVAQNNGRSALVSVPATFSTAQLSVSANNTCGSSAQRNATLYAVGPNPSTAIKGPTSVTSGQSNVTYNLPNATGVTYTWTVPAGATITSGQGTFRIRVRFGSTSGNITVVAKNSCGSTPTGILPVTVSAAVTGSLKQVTPISDDKTYIKAFPNPAQSFSNIIFNNDKADTKYTLVVIDLKGQAVIQKTGIMVAGVNNVQLDVSNLANAMYVVKLITDDRVRTIKLSKEK